MTSQTDERDEPMDTERASLLLIDDDLALCEVMSRALDGRGFDVTIAHTVEDAIQTIDAEPPDTPSSTSGCRTSRGLRSCST